jgi:hypothetical protein
MAYYYGPTLPVSDAMALAIMITYAVFLVISMFFSVLDFLITVAETYHKARVYKKLSAKDSSAQVIREIHTHLAIPKQKSEPPVYDNQKLTDIEMAKQKERKLDDIQPDESFSSTKSKNPTTAADITLNQSVNPINQSSFINSSASVMQSYNDALHDTPATHLENSPQDTKSKNANVKPISTKERIWY